MPIYNKQKRRKKILIWLAIIIILALMIVSFPNHPEFTEIVLFP